MIEVFPVSSYYLNLAMALKPIALPLLLLCFLVSFILFALDAFERVQLEHRVREFVVTGILISFWPLLVVGLKDLVDAFNQILIQNIFQMNWTQGIGGDAINQLIQGLKIGWNFWSWHIEILNFGLLLPLLLAKQIIYWIYIVFFFFYLVMGPLVIASGVLGDEYGSIRALLKEFIVLLLWQSTFVIVIGITNVGVGSSVHFLDQNLNFISGIIRTLVLIVLILLVPFITRKFASMFGGSSMGAPGFHWSSVLLGFTSAKWALSRAAAIPRRIGGALAGASVAEEEFVTNVQHFASIAEHTRMQSEQRKLHQDAAHMQAEMGSLAGATREAELVLEEEGSDLGHAEGELKNESAHFESARRPQFHTERHTIQHEETEREADFSEPSFETETPSDFKNQFFRNIIDKFRKIKKQNIQEIKKRLFQKRGAQTSDQYKDMQRVGIKHLLADSSSLQELDAYEKELDRFHSQFGSLYDANGKFIGQESQRPQILNSGEEQPS